MNVRRGIALLIYLAVTGEKHSRGSLISLLWPEYGESRGRHVLRNALYNLKKELPGGWFDTDREGIGLNPNTDIWVDVQAFRDYINDCRKHGHTSSQVCGDCLGPLTQAVALHRDDFLKGFDLKYSVNFDDWQFFQTERLRLDLTEALQKLLQCHTRQGEFDAAIEYARRWVSIDPLDERAHFRLMEIYASSGHRPAALQQYQECARLLEREIDAQPSEATNRLWESIKSNHFQQSPEEHLNGRLQESEASTRYNGDEIRLVTVLFMGFGEPNGSADGIQPEGSAAEDLVGSITRRETSRFGGSIERVLADGLLVVFGKARAKESDPEAAIRAALAICAETEHLTGKPAAAGINSGRLFIGANDRHAGPAIPVDSHTVSHAIRLARQSDPGQIFVGESTYRLTRRLFDFETCKLGRSAIGERAKSYKLKLVSSPTWKPRAIDGPHSEFVGRHEELKNLKRALDDMLEGRGQIICVAGEAGVGKSRLIEAFKEDALGATSGCSEILWLEGMCTELGTKASYRPFIDMLNRYFGPARNERIIKLLDAMQKAGDISDDRCTEIGAVLSNLLSANLGDRWDGILADADAAQVKHRTFVAIRDFFVSLAERQPLTLVFEDLHWSDSLSVDLISLLMETLADARLLLICIYRPDQHRSWQIGKIATRKCPDCHALISLEDLDTQQSRRLVQSLFDNGGLPAQAVNQVVVKSGGNPFYMTELAKSMVEAGHLYRSQGTWQAKEGMETPEAPESVQSVVLSRFDRLDPAQKEVTRMASVIGPMFQPRLLHLLLVDEVTLEERLQVLENHSFIYRERATPIVEYSFNHVLTQESIYQSIPASRQEIIHALVADSMEMLYKDDLSIYIYQLAYHYSKSGNDVKAVEFLVRAGESSRRAYSNDEAIDYFRRALRRTEETEVGEACNKWELLALTGIGKIFQTSVNSR